MPSIAEAPGPAPKWYAVPLRKKSQRPQGNGGWEPMGSGRRMGSCNGVGALGTEMGA